MNTTPSFIRRDALTGPIAELVRHHIIEGESPAGEQVTLFPERRSNLVVHGRLAARKARLAAARNGRHGLQIMSFEQAAVRLAGGFARPIDDESLRAAIQAVLPATPMGELESIKALPGMIDAAGEQRPVMLQFFGEPHLRRIGRGRTWGRGIGRHASNSKMASPAGSPIGTGRFKPG